MRLLLSVLLVTLGVIAMISGEADDSPGLQGIGLILISSVLFFSYRHRKPK